MNIPWKVMQYSPVDASCGDNILLSWGLRPHNVFKTTSGAPCNHCFLLWPNLLKCDPLAVLSGNTIGATFHQNLAKEKINARNPAALQMHASFNTHTLVLSAYRIYTLPAGCSLLTAAPTPCPCFLVARLAGSDEQAGCAAAWVS